MLDLINMVFEEPLDYIACLTIISLCAYLVCRWASLGSLRCYRKED